MIVSPIKLIESNIIKNIMSDDQIQPNGIDFTLDKLFQEEDGPFFLGKETKEHRKYRAAATMGGHFLLDPKTSYDFASNIVIELPNNMCAQIIGRSTLNRNSIFLTSGWWDSGYKGNIGGQIHNMSNQPAFIEAGARIGQIIFHEAAAASSYKGQYNWWSRAAG